MLQSALQLVESGQNLPMAMVSETFGRIMDGGCDEEQVARLLLALQRKGETVEELAGAAVALRRRMTPIRSRRDDAIDTCGTGGDASETFNISTAAALVAAAAGAAVAKHGNRAATSRSGSADALAALGVNIEANVACVERCLDQLGVCFCFAPLLHRAMKFVAPVRKKLGVPTIFNLLGPLVNPAGAPFQLLGVGEARLQPLMAEALLLLGTRRGVVVHGRDGLDEVTLTGPTDVAEAATGQVRRFSWTPGDFGLADLRLGGAGVSPVSVESTGKMPVPPRLAELRVAGPAESAAIIRKILAGHRGPARDIVILNAAAALWTVGKDASLDGCAGWLPVRSTPGPRPTSWPDWSP